MNLWQWMKRSDPVISLEQWAEYFTYGGLGYPIGSNQTLKGNTEVVEGSFTSLVHGAYKSNGIIFACMLTRLALFSEARFQFRRMVNGRPGELFGTDALRLLERPWPGGTTGDLLSRAIQDADLAGNFYATTRFGRFRRMRPDWVTIVMGSQSNPDEAAWELDAEVLGYLYAPGGDPNRRPVYLEANEVVHFAPNPDPSANFRGMSWLTPIIREIMADTSATEHKLRFFENGATPNMVVSLDPSIEKDKFDAWIKAFEEGHKGVANAYKTLYLGGGADVKVVGSDFKQLEFKASQGAGETRIAAAAGVPPVIVGLSEGLQAATYSNYGQARRRLSDGTLRPLWRNFAGSVANLINVPGGAELWYDDRDIPFLQEDQKDEAEINATRAQAIKALVDAGFDAPSVVEAVTTGDLSRLQHTGLFSVQLQPAGSDNGNGEASRALAALKALGQTT